MNILLLVLLLVSILVLGLIFGMYKFKDQFVDINELKAQSAAVPPAPEKVCELPGDTGFVSRNYQICCPDGDKSPNCICRLPGIKSCQQQYTECLEGKLFSEKSTEFIGQDNLSVACKKILDGCMSGDSSSYPNKSTDKQLINMKPDLSSPENSICMVDGYKKDNLDEFCSRTCRQIPECIYYQTGTITGSCSIYKGNPIPLEKGAASSSMGNYKLFTINPERGREGFKIDDTEPSTTTTQKLGRAAKFCMSDAVNKCSAAGGNSSDDCLCTHSIINDCRKLYNKCMKSGTREGIDTTTNSCKAQLGSCCSIIDVIDPKTSAKMDSEAQMGAGLKTDILCVPGQITSLGDCKTACLQNYNCDFINSNLTEAQDSGNAGSTRRGLTSDGTAPYCQLFRGKPSTSQGVVLGSKTANAKTIYMKQRGNPDELEVNAVLEKK